jgi:hemoglobin-like flavoprotein
MATTEQVTAEHRWLVQTSWGKLVPMASHVAELFYDRLFELNPLLEDSFPANLSEQGAQLMKALGLAVERLEEPDSIGPCLEELGRRHMAYGVRRGDYVTMGRALLWTLEQSLAEDFTPRVKEAWGVVYELIAALLIAGAEPGSGRRPVSTRVLPARRAV